MADTQRLPPPLVAHWEWQNKAACRGIDSDAFFHPVNERNQAREDRIAAAKAICRSRPAISECLTHALAVREPYRVWGGRSEDERAELLGVESVRYPPGSEKPPAPARYPPELTSLIALQHCC